MFLSSTDTAKKLSEAYAYGVVIEKNVTDLRAELHAAAALGRHGARTRTRIAFPLVGPLM